MDRRQVNEIWEYTNWLGEAYRFARVGSGKNAYIKTLAYLGRKVEEVKEMGGINRTHWMMTQV